MPWSRAASQRGCSGTLYARDTVSTVLLGARTSREDAAGVWGRARESYLRRRLAQVASAGSKGAGEASLPARSGLICLFDATGTDILSFVMV